LSPLRALLFNTHERVGFFTDLLVIFDPLAVRFYEGFENVQFVV
jgi:hypothetical protein